MNIVKKLLFFLSSQERNQLPWLMFMITLMALLDMIGIASIMPFVTVLTNPELIETNIFLNTMFQFSRNLGVETDQQFLFILGLLALILLVASIIFKGFTTYIISRFIYMREYSIGKLLVKSYLSQPYIWFLNRNSADLGKSILSEVGTIVGSGVKPMIELVAQSTVVIALLSLLIFVDLKIALSIFFIFGFFYWLVYKTTRNYIKKIGQDRLNANQLRFISISEAFGAIKDVKMSGLEKNYIERFSNPAKKMAVSQAYFIIVSQIPRFVLEAIAFGGMMFTILYILTNTGTIINVLPIITLYALVGYRLMPALQKIYNCIAQLRFGNPAINNLYNDLKNLNKFELPQDQTNSLPALTLSKKISLNNINFNYPNSSRTALKNISLDIPVKKTVGLVGATGSGKTTLVDIILGLLEAQQGTLEVDGNIITKENSRVWQKSIGYVPQQIYLADDTISGNIALGVEAKNINQKAVEDAAKIANLHEFIFNELPNKYETKTGERGIRLSGGQRQRIGIARALYHKPKVLILDEATSALDNLTEKAVMEAVNNLGKDITIILIAHRLSTVKKCDIIFFLEKGELKNKGTFEELLKINDNFRASAHK